MKSRKSPSPADPDAAAVRERMRTLLRRATQAEVARKTRVPIANVHRYLRHGKIPISFGTAVCREFGMNPSWLLLGEGTPWVADVTEEVSRGARDLLDLVREMNVVARMRLGALLDRDHARALREMNDALDQFERLRDRMHGAILPAVRDLADRFDRSVQEERLEDAVRMHDAVVQAARLCDDPELSFRLRGTQMNLAMYRGALDEALAIGEDLMRRGMAGTNDERFLREAHRLAAALRRQGRARRACEILRAALLLTRGSDARHARGIVRHTLGIIEMDRGRGREGMALLPGAYARLPPLARAHVFAPHAAAMLMTGAWDPADLPDPPEGAARLRGRGILAATVLFFAFWREEAGFLRRALDLHGPDAAEGDASGAVWPAACRAMLALREGGAPAGGGHPDTIPPLPPGAPRIDSLRASALRARLAHLAGDGAGAREAMGEAIRIVSSLPPGTAPLVRDEALHLRNILAIVPRDARGGTGRLRARAARRVRQLLGRGYAFLAACAADA